MKKARQKQKMMMRKWHSPWQTTEIRRETIEWSSDDSDGSSSDEESRKRRRRKRRNRKKVKKKKKIRGVSPLDLRVTKRRGTKVQLRGGGRNARSRRGKLEKKIIVGTKNNKTS